ncbi:MAG TPA: MaoC family dehydratase N-terminal domain-containing protein [Pyrinomonadaceae bacterium]|jgi:acyl dehydratase|nr:MaoC family dehydratase N-terminal domain-containing protein [Pyrinomonadaceae bacterium]
MRVNDVFTCERTFTVEDVREFSRLSGDEGTHHLSADERGRLMVHGLLTATLPTKIGGQINFLAREMSYQFQRPVFAGDTVRCEVTVTELDETEQYTRLSSSWVCRNQHGKEVMTGWARGVVRARLMEEI